MSDKVRELIAYGICGSLALLLNLSVFILLADYIEVYYILATVVAWICSTSFAFITNKFFVFKSRDTSSRIFIKEAISFLGSRCISGTIDAAGMYILVSILLLNHDIAKIILLVLIVINNYILGKFWVFKNKR